jgi:hypothetical protein
MGWGVGRAGQKLSACIITPSMMGVFLKLSVCIITLGMMGDFLMVSLAFQTVIKNPSFERRKDYILCPCRTRPPVIRDVPASAEAMFGDI